MFMEMSNIDKNISCGHFKTFHALKQRCTAFFKQFHFSSWVLKDVGQVLLPMCPKA